MVTAQKASVKSGDMAIGGDMGIKTLDHLRKMFYSFEKK
jgi:hypothetical protein